MDIVWQAEDSLREKKLESDLKDVLKTLVAFANSVAPEDTATLFIGEKDDGTVQGVTNTDNIQKKVKDIADKIYPEIYYRTSVYERDGKHCVRVDVKHNGLGPHFGGAAWVRKGSVTVEATEQLYQQMVEPRQNKVFTLSQWLNKKITVAGTFRGEIRNPAQAFADDPWLGSREVTLTVVNANWATFDGGSGGRSEPIEKLWITWDDAENRLKVLVRHTL